MSTVADKLTDLHGIKADLFAATREKGLDTTGRTLENLHELWGGISGGGALQAKTAVPSNVDVEVTPDDGYAALSTVNIAAALNLKPWNIRKGKTLFGVTGTADIAVTTEVPSDIPVSKEDADTAYEEAVGSAPKDEDGNDLDMMTLADDNGNITYGYFLRGAADDDLEKQSVYFAASDPIPLDYNTIIRWDGNTDGLEQAGIINTTYAEHYKVSESYVAPSSLLGGIIVFNSIAHVIVGLTYDGNEITWADGYSPDTPIEHYAVVYTDGINSGIVTNSGASWFCFVIKGASDVVIGDLHFPSGGIWFGKGISVTTQDVLYIQMLAYNSTTYPSEFTITRYDPATTDFSAVGWRRLSYHTTGELAGQWTYDDFSTTASSGGNFLKNIIQCSREKLYYNGAEVWPNPDQSAITAEEVTT